MDRPMSLAPYLLLSLEDRPIAALVAERHAESHARYVRCLNVAGRWAVRGSSPSPLLVWRPEQADAAAVAAKRCAAARGRPVEVLALGEAGWQEGGDVQLFTDAFEPALLGCAPQSAARTRRLRTEADKLEAFCLVVRAASTAADHAAFAEVSRAASKALRAKFGGGSITSAFAWLTGRTGQEALASVLAGEAELTGPLSVQQVAEAAALAQESEQLREQQG